MYAADAVQAAIYQDLNGALPCPVYDEAPPGSPMPYVVLGEWTDTPADTHDLDGSELTVTMHVWSDAPGTRETNEIMAAIDERLHHGQLVASGVRIVSIEREFAEVFREEDLTTGRQLRHAVLRYRITVQEE